MLLIIKDNNMIYFMIWGNIIIIRLCNNQNIQIIINKIKNKKKKSSFMSYINVINNPNTYR